jgi:hypothetical protein
MKKDIMKKFLKLKMNSKKIFFVDTSHVNNFTDKLGNVEKLLNFNKK